MTLRKARGLRAALLGATILLVVGVVGVSPAEMAHAASPLPDTTTGIHVGLPFDYYTTPAAMAGKVDYVFGSGYPGQPASTYHTLYLPYDRDAEMYQQAHDINWWRANHPNWIEYHCDRSTVAYEFGKTNSVPLDITNPAVLQYIEQTYIAPALSGTLAGFSGRFDGIAFDDLAFRNMGSWTGQRCGHYDATGHWVQQFNATSDDPAYRQAIVNWAQVMQSWIHANFPGATISGNFSWDPGYTSDGSALLSHLDVYIDEQGFTNGNNGPPYYYADGNWLTKMQTLQTSLAAGHGLFSINQEPNSFANLTTAQVQWALANYLLIKNNASYLYVTGYQEYGHQYIRPEYAAPIGSPTDTMHQSQGVWMRDFTNGLALVNPSSTQSYTVMLRAGAYKDLYGNPVGSVTLGPTSGLVLLGSGGTPPPATGALTLAQPLSLNQTSVARGGSITGSVTYKNNTSAPITIQSIWITSRPPGGTHAGGPYLSLSPAQGATTVQPGQAVTLTATRTIGANDPTGQWYAYSTYQDANGNWHDAPAPDVYFTVTS